MDCLRLMSQLMEQFMSEFFPHFCNSCCIKYIQLPSYHPQSNGQECFMDTFKCALQGWVNNNKGDTVNISPFISNNTKQYSEKWPITCRSTHEMNGPYHTGHFMLATKANTRQNNGKTISVGTPVFAKSCRPRQPNWASSTRTVCLWCASWKSILGTVQK